MSAGTEQTLRMLRRLRVGTGVDVHPWAGGRRLVLAGVEIPHIHGLAGHSDADVVAHAVTDAILGGAGMGDIGAMFPSDDAGLQGADSMVLLARALEQVRQRGCEVLNVDVVVIAQEPKLSPYRDAMVASLAETLGLGIAHVSLRATTTDRLGFVGRGEGAAAIATATVFQHA